MLIICHTINYDLLSCLTILQYEGGIDKDCTLPNFANLRRRVVAASQSSRLTAQVTICSRSVALPTQASVTQNQ